MRPFPHLEGHGGRGKDGRRGLHVALGHKPGKDEARNLSGLGPDIRDLPRLASAMQEAGCTGSEIAAYMAGNTYRVLEACIG